MKNENTLSAAKTNTARCLSAFSISVLPVSSITFAQPQLEEVVVTAQIRAESLQDVPISVATMSGETIDNYAISTLQELTTYIPNVNINQGADTPNLFIRGIGSGTNEGFEQSVGMFVDGVYAGRALQSSVSATTDLARVEILKGPQSILFGKNTIAGAVSITTSKPTDEFEGVAEGLWDPELDEQQYTFILSGPITDSVAGRVAVRHEKSDGWWENVTLDEKGPDNDEWFARGTLRWEPSDRLEILAKYEYGDFSRKGGPSVIYQSDIVGQETLGGAVPIPIVSDRVRGAGDVITSSDIRTDLTALTVNWDLDFATLTSISAYSAYDRDRVQNTDSVAVASINRASEEKFDQFSQEVRLVSPGGDMIDWIAGAYYQTADLDRNEEITDLDFALSGPLSVPPLVFVEDLRGDNNDRIFDQQADSWSAFAQGTWNVAETLSFTAGLRYNEETKDVDKIILPNPALGFRAGGTTLFAIPGSGKSETKV
ncbi:MAG: TonB-dependent receptor, partial [Pseudomonadota bacterium]